MTEYQYQLEKNFLSTKVLNVMQSFYKLEPEIILESIEKAGYQPTGQIQQLNSYENRVFDVYLEGVPRRIIAKYYRPGRWSKQAISEEHEFLLDLKQEGIPAIAPLILNSESTILETQSIFYSLFPKAQGRMPDELLDNDFVKIGRSLAQLHNLGEQKAAPNRPLLSTDSYGDPDLEIISKWIEPQLWSRYEEAAHFIFDTYDELNQEFKFQRIHGDCHKGNLLNNGKKFFFVDFDDFLTGPVSQDFWMLIADTKEQEKINLDHLLKGYEELRSFEHKETKMFPLLKAMRIIHYAAWIAKRWKDPSFPRLFPAFNTYNYWAEETETIEQLAWTY